MRTRARRALLAGLVLLSAFAIAAPARADIVTDWNAIAAAALESPGTAVPPGAGQGAISGVHLAMVHGAVYDAVNAIAGGHEPYVSSPSAEPGFSQEAAVAAAARHMLLNGGLNGAAGFAPGRVALIEAAYTNTLAGIPPGPAREGGIATGVAAATSDDRGTGRRRPLPRRAVHVPGRDPARRMAADERRQRPCRLAEGRQAVRAPGSRPVPRPAAACAPHEGVRRRLRRGQGDRSATSSTRTRRSDGGGAVLGR